MPTYAVLAAVLLAAPGQAQESPPLWGGLRPGPYAVGFRSTWQRDPSRRYDIVFDDRTHYANGKSPRPILINVWYPAKSGDRSAPMRHRDYLSIDSDDPQLSRYAVRLASYEREVVSKELMAKKPDELDEKERGLLEGFWDTPTASRRGAAEAGGKFPVVIYHAGAQSSYEDNAALCEFLASHGYVVLGSPFADGKGRFFNIDAQEGSVGDFRFLIAHASGLPNADWQHIGLVGHSAGAQAALYFRAHDASAVDAVVSLDTTQDYYSTSSRGWELLVKYLTDHVENMDGPVLMAANDHAIFQLMDAMVKADRYYLLTHELEHNDFIAQGIARKWLECRAKPDDRALESAYHLARAQYEGVCKWSLVFLDAHLKGDVERRDQLNGSHRDDAPGPYIVRVPRGASGSEPFRLDSTVPPTPRQLRELMSRVGVDRAIEILDRYREANPIAPVFHGDLGFAIAEEFLELGRIRDARAVTKAYDRFDPKNDRGYFRIGKAYEKFGYKKGAIEQYRRALLLDPDDSESAARLKSLIEETKEPKPSRPAAPAGDPAPR